MLANIAIRIGAFALASSRVPKQTLPPLLPAAVLGAMLAMASGACGPAVNRASPSAGVAPATPTDAGRMEILLADLDREMRARGTADAARERLIATLLAAVRDPATGVPAPAETAPTAVPAHFERALSGMRAAQGDSAAIARILRELATRNVQTP